MEEVRLGWIAAGQRARFQKAGIADIFDPRFSDAASPGWCCRFSPATRRSDSSA